MASIQDSLNQTNDLRQGFSGTKGYSVDIERGKVYIDFFVESYEIIS